MKKKDENITINIVNTKPENIIKKKKEQNLQLETLKSESEKFESGGNMYITATSSSISASKN